MSSLRLDPTGAGGAAAAAPAGAAVALARSDRVPWLRCLVLFLLGAALTASTIWWGINPHDEGLVLQSAARIADDGQLPYRDFYANYGPGQYVLNAGLHLVFGPSLVSWRVLRVLLDATVGVLAYVLARRDAPEPLALGAWLAVAGAMAWPSVPSPNPTAIALGLGSILLARRSPLGAGALAGLAVVFRLDVGAAAVLGAVIAAWPDGGRRAALRVAGAAASVALVLLAPFVLADPRAFWDQTLGFALDEQGLQRLPLPGAYDGGFLADNALQRWFAYVPLAGVAVWALAAVRTRTPLRGWAPVPLVLAGVAYLLARADDFHLIPLTAVLPILLAAAAARELRGARRGRTVVAAALVGVLALIALHGLDRKRILILDPPALARLDAPAADGVRAPADDARALNELVPFVDHRVAPGRPVFVALPRYDLVKVGDPLLYTLLDRPNPTRYDVMQPGVVTTAPVQREIVGDLERARPALAVRWLSPVLARPEPDGAGVSSGVRILDRYLARTYIPIRRFGDYQVLRRTGR